MRHIANAIRPLAVLTATIAAVSGMSVMAESASAASGRPNTVYVAPHGSSSNTGLSCASARYSSIESAVQAVQRGGAVMVCRGTYREDVLIRKPLHVIGHGAVIDASGLENGVQIVSSWVSVSGITARNANGEGFLVGVDTQKDGKLLPKSGPALRHILLWRVSAVNDDLGANPKKPNCKYPGDCGGGIHLNVVSRSVVKDSVAVGNADGILLTDDYGPASHNRILNNWVTDNKTECGIVLPSHNTGAVSYNKKTYAVTARHPLVAGVYDNLVKGNVTMRNGTATAPPQFGGGGSGSGIGLFGSGPGTGVWDNVIVDNVSIGNGLAGFTIHAHHPGGEDMNGNIVRHNMFGRNNLGGDPYDGPPVTDMSTTGVAVFSVPRMHITISDNLIMNNKVGVWLSKTVTATGLHRNRYVHVKRQVVRG